MADYIRRLSALGSPVPDVLAIERVLHSLPPSYEDFIADYLQKGRDESLTEVLAKLEATKVEEMQDCTLLKVNKTTSFKKHGKGKFSKPICAIIARRRGISSETVSSIKG
jgi:hypothetical protein